MAVLVTSSITKTGSSRSGRVVAIAVVRTVPGYGPSAGHTGLGTVVAMLP